MTFQQLYKMALRRLGDTQYVVTTVPSVVHDIQDVKDEIQAAYVEAANVLAGQGFFAVVTDEDESWAADLQEKDLRSVLAAVPRKILAVSIYPGNDTTKAPQPIVFPWRGSIRQRDRRGANIWWPSNPATWEGITVPEAYLRGFILGFRTAPSSAQAIRVTYAPVVETLSADGDIPLQVPAEHHEYIAQRAAMMLMGGENSASKIIVETFYKLEDGLQSVAPNLNLYSPNVKGAWTMR